MSDFDFKMTPKILKSLMLPPNPAVNCKTIMEDQARATAEAQVRWKNTLAERAAEEAKRRCFELSQYEDNTHG